MKRNVVWAVVMAGCVAIGALAGEMPQGTVAADSPEFARIKSLAGKWKGTAQHGAGEQEPAAVEYKVTSGGSAVVETLFPSTPHEMVSVYHDVGGKLAMTHYCMLHNQPQLGLVSADGQHVELSLVESPGIDAAHDAHMHALSLIWKDPDHMTQVWTSYGGGKPQGTTTITLSRAQ